MKINLGNGKVFWFLDYHPAYDVVTKLKRPSDDILAKLKIPNVLRVPRKIDKVIAAKYQEHEQSLK